MKKFFRRYWLAFLIGILVDLVSVILRATGVVSIGAGCRPSDPPICSPVDYSLLDMATQALPDAIIITAVALLIIWGYHAVKRLRTAQAAAKSEKSLHQPN